MLNLDLKAHLFNTYIGTMDAGTDAGGHIYVLYGVFEQQDSFFTRVPSRDNRRVFDCLDPECLEEGGCIPYLGMSPSPRLRSW